MQRCWEVIDAQVRSVLGAVRDRTTPRGTSRQENEEDEEEDGEQPPDLPAPLELLLTLGT